MRLSLKGGIAKTFNQIFDGGVGDTAWKGHMLCAASSILADS